MGSRSRGTIGGRWPMGDVFKRGSGWSIRWYEGGRRRVMASKQPSYAEAKRMLLEIEARVARGDAGIPEKRAFTWITVADLIERFCAQYSRPRIKDIDRYRYEAQSVLRKAKPLYRLSVEQVTQADVARLRDSLLRRFARGTVRNVIRTLSSAFSWAVKESLAPRNPCRGIEKPVGDCSLDYLTQEEAMRLLDMATANAETRGTAYVHAVKVAIALALYAGLRKGEILGLRWIDVDTITRRLTIARSYRTTPKDGKTRHLRLPQALVPLLRDWRNICPPSRDALVVPIGRKESRSAKSDTMLTLRQLMAASGLRSVRCPWHLLRHTFASHYMMSGGSLLALSKILGHSDVKITMIYAHLAPDYLGEEMDRVNFGKS